MPAKSQDPQLPNGLDQNAISGLAQLLCLLLSSLDAKTIDLLRFYELQIDFLQRRLHGRLVPNQAERAAFARLAAEIGRPDLEAHVSLFHPETLFRWHRAMISAKLDALFFIQLDTIWPGSPSMLTKRGWPRWLGS